MSLTCATCRLVQTRATRARKPVENGFEKAIMSPKRKNDGSGENGGASKKSAKGGGLVKPKRVRELNKGKVNDGPVIYWYAQLCGRLSSHGSALHSHMSGSADARTQCLKASYEQDVEGSEGEEQLGAAARMRGRREDRVPGRCGVQLGKIPPFQRKHSCMWPASQSPCFLHIPYCHVHVWQGLQGWKSMHCR